MAEQIRAEKLAKLKALRQEAINQGNIFMANRIGGWINAFILLVPKERGF